MKSNNVLRDAYFRNEIVIFWAYRVQYITVYQYQGKYHEFTAVIHSDSCRKQRQRRTQKRRNYIQNMTIAV